MLSSSDFFIQNCHDTISNPSTSKTVQLSTMSFIEHGTVYFLRARSFDSYILDVKIIIGVFNQVIKITYS